MALSHAVLVSTAGAVGTELLKNLVLPGLGGFTVVDAGMYPTSSETGQQSNTTMVIPQSNFFYPPPSASTDEKSVAEVISTTMNEVRSPTHNTRRLSLSLTPTHDALLSSTPRSMGAS